MLDRAEIRQLYEKHGSALVAYLCCCGLDFASAEDIVQQVFVKLLDGRTPEPDSAAAYLYRAVRNAFFNLHRDRRRETKLEEAEEWFTEPSGNREEVIALQAALTDLPQEQRETVFLKIWGGMTFEEIAATLDISLNTAASRYRYALEKLREQLLPGKV
jgi:RNA polymerase sigma-70 factor, ECF subfamily